MATENPIFRRFEKFASNLNNHIEQPVRHHLAKVYCCLTGTLLTASVGSVVHISGLWEAGFLSLIASLGLVLGLMFTPDNGKNQLQRLGMLLGFGFLTGHSLGLLLEIVIMVDPQIIVTALVGTTVVFISLSLTALFAQRGQYLFLGGILFSVLSSMMILSLGNLFFRSYFVNQIQLYVGLAVMAGFILFDTQIIMEKCRMGNKDYIGHSLDLFYDFVTMFRKLLIILTQKEVQKKDNKRKN